MTFKAFRQTIPLSVPVSYTSLCARDRSFVFDSSNTYLMDISCMQAFDRDRWRTFGVGLISLGRQLDRWLSSRCSKPVPPVYLVTRSLNKFPLSLENVTCGRGHSDHPLQCSHEVDSKRLDGFGSIARSPALAILLFPLFLRCPHYEEAANLSVVFGTFELSMSERLIGCLSSLRIIGDSPIPPFFKSLFRTPSASRSCPAFLVFVLRPPE